MKTAILASFVGLAVSRIIVPVPNPYRWDESFTVQQPQLDDEHRGLFNAILLIERENTKANLDAALIKYRDHFELEEGMFEQTMPKYYVLEHKNKHKTFMRRMGAWTEGVSVSELFWAKEWLVNHIKNTDFQYIGPGLMPHEVPKPYHWDESFEVFYQRIDDEHKVLFDSIREVAHHPESTKALNDLKYQMRAHFDYEQGIFCNSKNYHQCNEHKKKHNAFYKVLNDAKTPVPKTMTDWAKNWLVQHIKNTDFQYKFKLENYLHTVPRPYVWVPELQVYYKDMDDEHVILFDAIRDSVEHPDDAAKYDHLQKVMKEHFDHEQSLFKEIPNFDEYIEEHIAKHDKFLGILADHSVPLDCDFINYAETWLVQHIKNTDFAYRGKMVHPVPEPYIWDESFMVFYQRLDDEHKVLFDCIREVGENPGDASVFADCKSKLRMHFDYEEEEFCKIADYDCHGHYLKHYNFQTKFQAAKIPVPQETVQFAKDWLAQHIKNTDHAYRGKLYLRRHYVVPDPYIWDESFLVDIKQLDDEHVDLFDSVREVEASPGDKAKWEHMLDVFNAHFRNEEAMFSIIPDNTHDIADHRLRHLGVMNTIKGALLPITKEITDFTKNWLAQHIKNTDFDYKGKMPKVYPVPDPYIWDSSFAVKYPDMDVEHKGLFKCIEDMKTDKSEAALASCLKLYEDHFEHEQSLFDKSGTYPDEEAYQHHNKHDAFLAAMRGLTAPVDDTFIAFATNWLAQHIKNTDFRYMGKMPFPVPDPIVWDESFQVNYQKMDDDHKKLFDLMEELKQNPNDVDILNNNRDWYRDHFDREEKLFMACGTPCNADAHKKKHDVFFKTLTWVTVPVSQEYIAYAANWFVQHIKNTDFTYKYKLPTAHKVPQPYIWNKEFEVAYKQLDDEHIVLFDAMEALRTDNDAEHLEKLRELLRNHFYYEEAQFCDSLDLPWDYCKEHKKRHVEFSEKFSKVSAPAEDDEIYMAMDWLAQHIKNTDFGYKGHLKHTVPEPYVWDASFATDYQRIDEEHDVLFADILAVSQHPDDDAKLEKLKEDMKHHFIYEEGHFCSVEDFNCVDHRVKHYGFWVILEDIKVPVNCEQINWAKNWLAQHIKNTDHQYKERLNVPESEPGLFAVQAEEYPNYHL